MATTTTTPTDHDEQPHYEECLCPISTSPPTITPLPLESRIPTPNDPSLPGLCIYHHRLSTRDAETDIFTQYAPEIDELKEVISSGMVRFQRGGPGHGGQVVRQKATTEQMSEATDALKQLTSERDRLIRELWDKFVARWGGRVERRDDGTMFVVDEGRHVLDQQDDDDDEAEGEGKGKGKEKEKLKDQVQDDEADPYVRRMREVQARMDDLEVAEERKRAKRTMAGKKADEYAKGAASSS